MSTIPDKMMAVTFTGVQQAELAPWPCDTTPPAPDEIVGRALVSLVSPGTEINAGYADFEGGIAKPTYPRQTGYAVVVRVDAVGAEVKDIKPGDHIFQMGSHASRQRTRRSTAVLLPEGLDPKVAVFCRLMGVSWTTLVTTTARPADRVLVTGLGPVGNLAAQIFTAAGYRVTAVDPVESRRTAAVRVGLSDVRAAVPLDDAALVGDVALVLECSGHEQAAVDACKLVRKRGEVVLVGVPWRRRTEVYAFEILHAVFHRYAVLRSGWEWELPINPTEFKVGSVMGDLSGAVQWLAQGRVKAEGMYKLAQPGDCQNVYQDLLHQRGSLSVVFDWSTS